jgi:hypothetical protein
VTISTLHGRHSIPRICSFPAPLRALQYGTSAPPGITSITAVSFHEPSHTSFAMMGFTCSLCDIVGCDWHGYMTVIADNSVDGRVTALEGAHIDGVKVALKGLHCVHYATGSSTLVSIHTHMTLHLVPTFHFLWRNLTSKRHRGQAGLCNIIPLASRTNHLRCDDDCADHSILSLPLFSSSVPCFVVGSLVYRREILSTLTSNRSRPVLRALSMHCALSMQEPHSAQLQSRT